MGAKIHPLAVVDPSAEIADGVRIGPFAVIEADVTIGRDCEIRSGAVVRRFTTMGAGNVVDTGCVLGGHPQDLKFDPESRTWLKIGEGNVFREHVTLSRATTPGGATVIGSGCFFMTGSHVGHDSTVGDGVILVNGAALAGHVEVGPRAMLSANTGVHQFCWVGELVMTRGQAGASQHVPPFCILKGINGLSGLNRVGLRRAGVTAAEAAQVKEAYRILYRSGLTTSAALEQMDAHAEWGAPADRFRRFVRRVLEAKPPFQRGLCRERAEGRDEDDS